jgi:hypothetical protein
VITQLQEALEHLDKAHKAIKQFETREFIPTTLINQAGEEIDRATAHLTRRLEKIEAQALYRLKYDGTPWPDVLEE